MGSPYQIIVKTSGAQSAATDGAGSSLSCPYVGPATLMVEVTAVAGTNPVMSVKVQARDDANGTWGDLYDAIGANIVKTGTLTAAVARWLSIPALPGGGQVRVNSSVGSSSGNADVSITWNALLRVAT